MCPAWPADEIAHDAAVPRLLVELPSRLRVFFGNLRDLLFPRRQAPLELHSTPAEFWPDVFVTRRLPWRRFLQSGVYHLIAGAVVIGLAHLFAMQPRAVPATSFDRSQVIYYQASEYLPAIDTRRVSDEQPEKADPEFSRQPIISVPPEADNHEQTIVAPPGVKLKHAIALPNIVAWSDTAEKPRLDIPPAPLTPAADITRLAPRMEAGVVTPPPDAARLAYRRNAPELQNSVAAPPAELRASSASAALQTLQPALIAPPADVENTPTRQLGVLNIAPSAVMAPAPQLPVSEQRTISGGRGSVLNAGATPVVPPPPSLSAAGSPRASSGSRGQVIALNLHPALEAPATPPAGNRRGAFAATPEGRTGASGAPGSTLGAAASGAESHGIGDSKGSGGASARKGTSDLPTGLYVGNAAAASAAPSGSPSKLAENSVSPNVAASVRPPRVSSTRPLQPESETRLSEAERAVFGNRKFYSVTLNMPNLNSAGGSWVIRFAEVSHGSGSRESDDRDANRPAATLSQPMATRKVDPSYPTRLMRENVSGTVILYAVIHADGSVGNVRVLRGVDERLDRFATEAVAQWRFEPAMKNGSPVDVEATFQIPFQPTRLGTSF